MSHLRDEIFEQPVVFERLLTEGLEQVRAVTRAVFERPPKLVVFAARGSSDNAVTYAHYLIETYLGLPVSSSAPSIYSLYQRFPNLSDALVIGISQSGQSPDVVSVLAEAQRQGALTIAITNDRSSPIAQSADLLIEQRAGQELSVAATKTYTTQLMAVAMLVAELSQDAQLLAGIHGLPGAARLALELEEASERMAEDLARAQPAWSWPAGSTTPRLLSWRSSSRSWLICLPMPIRLQTLCMARWRWRSAIYRRSCLESADRPKKECSSWRTN